MLINQPKIRFVRVAVISLLSCLLVLCALSCEQEKKIVATESTFGIYLTKENIPPSVLAAQATIQPEGEPIISLQDIAKYVWAHHTIYLTATGKQKLDTLGIPVHGRSFVACVNNVAKYDGAFWTPISSIPFSGTKVVDYIRQEKRIS